MIRQHIQNQQDLDKEVVKALEDDEIIKRVAGGEKNLYALIIRKYNQRLYRIALSIINSKPEVEDIMQTAYIKAYENLDKFRFQSSFSTWITKILINESLMYLKKREQTAIREKSRFTSLQIQNAIELQTPLMHVLNSELKAILEFSIRKLPEKYRIVFIMREMECMSIAETMECLGLTEANVKVKLNRAKVLLRDKLSVYLKDNEVLQLYKPYCDRIVDNVMEKITIGINSKMRII